MYMAESLFNDAARSLNAGVGGHTILMIAECDLLSECLAEVLARKFPDWDVFLQGGGEISGEEEESARLILLYRLPPGLLPGLIRRIRHGNPSAAIALVTDGAQILDDRYFRDLVEAREIEGILPINLRLDVFLAAVDLLAKGGEHFPSALLQRLRRSEPPGRVTRYDPVLASAPREAAALRLNGGGMGLTTREVQILNMLCEGTQNKIIADRLNLSENTVKVHIRNIYKKMHVRNRTEAASRFFNADRAGVQGRGH